MAVPKTAFLVTAHDQPLIARRLLDRLDVPWARTFVHVDRKVDIRPFRAGYAGGATFLPDSRRVPVYWGGFSIAQAMLNMIEHALEEMPDLERVVTLSGVDYPIRPLAEIGGFFARHPDAEFMRVDRDVNPHRTQIHDWYIRRRFLGDNRYFNPKSSPVPALAASARVVARMFPRIYIPGLQIYHGGCWWSLSRRGLDDLVGYFRAHPDHLAWFRQARSAVELVFQTGLKATPSASRITQDLTIPNPRPESENPFLHGVHYIDWRAGGPHPKNLTLDDLAALRASPALFARKTHSSVSLPLLDRLDEEDAAPYARRAALLAVG
jgi:Core-2/I-Branching enzyme